MTYTLHTRKIAKEITTALFDEPSVTTDGDHEFIIYPDSTVKLLDTNTHKPSTEFVMAINLNTFQQLFNIKGEQIMTSNDNIAMQREDIFNCVCDTLLPYFVGSSMYENPELKITLQE